MRQPFIVTDIDKVKSELTVQRGDLLLKRHLDDLKKIDENFESEEIEIPDLTDQNEFEFFDPDTEGTETSYFDKNMRDIPENAINIPENHPQNDFDIEIDQCLPRRGTRTRNQPSKYSDFELY